MCTPLEYYKNLTNGQQVVLDLNQSEAAVSLKCFDHGIEALTDDELAVFNCVIGKIKDEIWP